MQQAAETINYEDFQQFMKVSKGLTQSQLKPMGDWERAAYDVGLATVFFVCSTPVQAVTYIALVREFGKSNVVEHKKERLRKQKLNPTSQSLLDKLLGAASDWIQSINVFYRQDRIGEKGETYAELKFQSMFRQKDNAGKDLPNNQRRSKIGNFFRILRFDEIPNLWSVFRRKTTLFGTYRARAADLRNLQDQTSLKHQEITAKELPAAISVPAIYLMKQRQDAISPEMKERIEMEFTSNAYWKTRKGYWTLVGKFVQAVFGPAGSVQNITQLTSQPRAQHPFGNFGQRRRSRNFAPGEAD